MTDPTRYIYGGDGSHWDGCEDTHWDCKIARLEARIAELEAEAKSEAAWANEYHQKWEQAEAEADKLAEALVQVRINEHEVCDDCWYSCPKSDDYCDGERGLTECYCGKDRNNQIIDPILAAHKARKEGRL